MNKSISSIDPVEQDDAPTDMAVSRKRPRWARQILQNARSMEQMGVLKNTRPDLLPEGSLRNRESIMMRHLLLWLNILPLDRSLLLLQQWDVSCIRWMSRQPFSIMLLMHYFLGLEV